MNKFILIIGILLFLLSKAVHAEQIKYPAYVLKSNSSIGNKLHRIPALLPTVEVLYDSDVRSVTVLCSDDSDAKVTIYDELGNCIVSSNSISDTLYLPKLNTSSYQVRIESAQWYATVDIFL